MGFIAPSLWNDEKVRRLPIASKTVFIYLLTGPESLLIPGLINGDTSTIAGALREPFDPIDEAMTRLESVGLVGYDREARLIRVPNAPRYNAPPNGNVLASWYRRWTQIQDSPLKHAHVASVRSAVELRIQEATKKKAKKGVVESWRTAWEETFGTADIHARQRDMFSQVFTQPQSLLKPFAEPLNLFMAEGSALRPSPLAVDREGECVNSSGAGSDDDMEDEHPHERDQGLKRFPEPSDPDPDPRSLSGSKIQIQIPDPRSRSQTPEPSQGANVVALPLGEPLLERARRAWDVQEKLRARIAGLRPLEPTERRLAHVVACLTSERPSDDDVEHVLAVYAANAIRDPGAAAYFDGDSNWVPDNFKRTVGKPAMSSQRGPHFKVTGHEKYGDGKSVVTRKY